MSLRLTTVFSMYVFKIQNILSNFSASIFLKITLTASIKLSVFYIGISCYNDWIAIKSPRLSTFKFRLFGGWHCFFIFDPFFKYSPRILGSSIIKWGLTLSCCLYIWIFFTTWKFFTDSEQNFFYNHFSDFFFVKNFYNFCHSSSFVQNFEFLFTFSE